MNAKLVTITVIRMPIVTTQEKNFTVDARLAISEMALIAKVSCMFRSCLMTPICVN